MNKLKDNLDKINKTNKTNINKHNINSFKDKKSISQIKKLINNIDYNYTLNNINSLTNDIICNDVSNILIIKEKINIEHNINSLDDLIDITNKYPLLDSTEYNINLAALLENL